jgi:hypothetical protein
MNGNTDEERLKRTLYRYMSQELGEELLKRYDATLEGERVARAFQPLNEPALVKIEQRTAAAWQDNTFYRAWT